MNTKKIFTVIFALTFAISAIFADTNINKEISRYPAEQRILIYAYMIMLDGEEGTMDGISSDEQEQMIETFSLADGDWELLESEMDLDILDGNEAEAIYARFAINSSFNKLLDIEPLNNIAKALKESGKSSVATNDAMTNTIASCVKGLNPKNKSPKLESLEVVCTLMEKLINSDKLPNSVGYALQDDTVKNYILNGKNATQTNVTHDAIADTIKDDLNKKFKAALDVAQLDIIVAQLKAKNMADNQIIGITENFLADMCKEVKNPKAKNKKIQESLEVIAGLFQKLSDADNPVNTVALVLNDNAIKQYILNN